jgi:hypothetical protein
MAKINALNRLVGALRTPSSDASSGKRKEPRRARRDSASSGDSSFEALPKTALIKRARNALSPPPAGDFKRDDYVDFALGTTAFGKASKGVAKAAESAPKPSVVPALPTPTSASATVPTVALADRIEDEMRLPRYMQKALPAPFPWAEGERSPDSSATASPTSPTPAKPARRRSSSEPGSEVSSD